MTGSSTRIRPSARPRRWATWGAFWGLLFGALFFVPVLGMVVGGAMGALFGGMAKAGLNKEFLARVRDSIKPGTSALFMVIEKVTPDKVIEALKPYGGTVLRTSLSADAEQKLREAMQGEEKVPAGDRNGHGLGHGLDVIDGTGGGTTAERRCGSSAAQLFTPPPRRFIPVAPPRPPAPGHRR